MVKEMLPFNRHSALKLMCIGQDVRLSNDSHGNHLPANWTTLYELSRLPDEAFDRAIADGTINPECKRRGQRATRAVKKTCDNGSGMGKMILHVKTTLKLRMEQNAMDGNVHDSRGKFKRGNKAAARHHAGGRKPRRFSVSRALAIAADEVEDIDKEGAPLTNAQVAARWLWEVVRTGKDRGELVSSRDRMEAMKLATSIAEPSHSLVKALEQEREADERQQREAARAKLDAEALGLTEHEIAVLEDIERRSQGM